MSSLNRDIYIDKLDVLRYRDFYNAAVVGLMASRRKPLSGTEKTGATAPQKGCHWVVSEPLVFAGLGMRDELAVIGYIRVSSVGQALRGGGQETQEAAVRAAGAKLMYRDVLSGVSTERPGLDEMLRSLREGDQVVVYRLDRLSRSVGHLLTLCEDFERQGVTLVSTSEGVNTSGAIGRLLVAVIGAVASIERETMLSRTADGIARARAEGKP